MSDQVRPHARPEGLGEPERPHARPTGLGAIPEAVAEAATARSAVPPQGTVLLGLFFRPTGSSALLRLADGRVARVVEGDRVDGAVVASIGETRLVLARGASEESLSMPA